jgi:hypothetical protein
MVLLTIMYYGLPLIVTSNIGEKVDYHSVASGYFQYHGLYLLVHRLEI